jgi:hypothetical protein
MRWIRWVDVVTYVAIPIMLTVAMGFAFLTPQEWDAVKLGFAIGVPAVAWVIAGIMLVMRWRSRPTFQIWFGSRIWTNGIEEIKPAVVEKALEHYLGLMLERCPLDVRRSQLLGMFGGLRAEFTAGPVTRLGSEKEYAGLQSGRSIRVQWLGGFDRNAFWHELVHMQRQLIHGLDADYQHEGTEWWRLVSILKKTWTG